MIKPKEYVKTFGLTKEQMDKLDQWSIKHKKKCKKSKYYIFSHASGIGISSVYKCECGKSIDITDYGSW